MGLYGICVPTYILPIHAIRSSFVYLLVSRVLAVRCASATFLSHSSLAIFASYKIDGLQGN